MNIGQSVKINIRNGDKWHAGAVESLNGLSGVIKDIKLRNDYGYPNDRTHLVEFPDNPEPWHNNQIPSPAWWFSEDEMEKIDE